MVGILIWSAGQSGGKYKEDKEEKTRRTRRKKTRRTRRTRRKKTRRTRRTKKKCGWDSELVGRSAPGTGALK